jgi:hypothetical protein
MTRHVGHERPANTNRQMMPAQGRRLRVRLTVVAIAVAIGEINAADEGEIIIDHDDLLVMAMNEMLSGVETHPHARPGRQRLAISSHIAGRGG